MGFQCFRKVANRAAIMATLMASIASVALTMAYSPS